MFGSLVLMVQAVLGGDALPPLTEAQRLPNHDVCYAQKCLASKLVKQYKYAIELSPSRAHLLQADLARAEGLYNWWDGAEDVNLCGYYSDENRRHLLAGLQKVVGPERWFMSDWPWLEQPSFDYQMQGAQDDDGKTRDCGEGNDS